MRRDGKGDGGIIIPQEFKDRYDARVKRELIMEGVIERLMKESPELFPYHDIDCRPDNPLYKEEEEGANDG